MFLITYHFCIFYYCTSLLDHFVDKSSLRINMGIKTFKWEFLKFKKFKKFKICSRCSRNCSRSSRSPRSPRNSRIVQEVQEVQKDQEVQEIKEVHMLEEYKFHTQQKYLQNTNNCTSKSLEVSVCEFLFLVPRTSSICSLIFYVDEHKQS